MIGARRRKVAETEGRGALGALDQLMNEHALEAEDVVCIS